MARAAEVKYTELGEVALLTDEEKDTIEKKQKALDKLLEEQGVAKYKIDLNVSKDWSITKPSVGALSFWESGRKFHGGGDCKMYICPGKDKGINDCEGFIPDTSQGLGFLVCPVCHNIWQGRDVAGEILARLPPRGWAELILKYYARLGMNADLRMKYPLVDIREAAQKEQEKQLMGDILESARAKRPVRIYTMRAIIKDTSAGADLFNRILAFVTA